jgi:alkanesulfonate monooxygenase SsuD/methylene tetrahydromethanopterin reductase-like flavin-dependent oxidoreductase (luciferase family)
VTCPTVRIHPAIIAQAGATAGAMMDGRFFLGVGTGENLNEHIKDSYEDRGVSADEAEERAARTVNKQRAEHGETKQSAGSGNKQSAKK